MPVITARRATDRDLASLDRLCAEASKATPLWSARRERFNPAAWLSARTPVVIVSDGADPVGFAVALADNPPLGGTKCAEALVYVVPNHRRRGGGRAAMAELISVSRTMGLWKLIGYVPTDDASGRLLLDRVDFREVGVLVKHVQIAGTWRDVALYERLVMAARKSMPSMSGG